MASIFTSLLVKFLDVDTLCTLVAKAIASIFMYASKKGGKAWDIAKTVILKINLWTSLFLQVYDDEELDENDEKIIAEAISNETSIEKIVDLIKSKIEK